jgi:transposase-like protein
MNIHKNARLTPQGRLLLVQRVEESGWRIVEAAKAAGISQRQGYRWRARYRRGGAAELHDRSSAPRCCKHRIAGERITAITALRRQRMSWPAIARQLGMPVSTVGAILRRLGLGKLAALEAKPVVVRYERQRPGELIHIDSKKLGRIAGIGHRITGRTGGRSIAITASAGKPCTCASTTRRGWATAKSWQTSARKARWAFSSVRSAGSRNRASRSNGS